MLIALSSILVLTALTWLLNKKLPIHICPICAGTTFTWLSLIAGMLVGKLSVFDYQVPFAILAGGTVVGAMAKLETRIQAKFVLSWKTIFVVIGFGTVYALLHEKWVFVILGIALNIATTFALRKNSNRKENSEEINQLQKEMESCC